MPPDAPGFMLLPRTVTMFKMRWLLLRFNQAGGIINHCHLDLAFRKHLRIHSSPSSHGQGFGLIITQHSGPPGSWLGPALPSCTSVPTSLHPQLPHGLQFNPVGLSGWPLSLLPQGHRSRCFIGVKHCPFSVISVKVLLILPSPA